MWEFVLAKLPGIFGLFATARFYSSKRNRRCAGCRFVTDAVGAQISIKKSRNFMRNGWGKPPMEIPHTFFEGEDVFMKGKMYLWRGRGRLFMKGKMYSWRGRWRLFMKGKMKIIHEGEDVFMKGKMYLWRGRCIYEGEDVFMKGKMCLWRGRCIYEGEDVFMKGRCIYEGEDVFMKGKMYLWRGKKISGIFEGIENKMLFKNQRNPWNFSSQK